MQACILHWFLFRRPADGKSVRPCASVVCLCLSTLPLHYIVWSCTRDGNRTSKQVNIAGLDFDFVLKRQSSKREEVNTRAEGAWPSVKTRITLKIRNSMSLLIGHCRKWDAESGKIAPHPLFVRRFLSSSRRWRLRREDTTPHHHTDTPAIWTKDNGGWQQVILLSQHQARGTTGSDVCINF